MKTTRDFGIFMRVVLPQILFAQIILAIIPQSLEKCHLEDTFCLTKQAQGTLKAFVDGIPELGIKPFDKMHLDNVDVTQNKLHYEMKNNVIEGFNNTIFDEVSIDMDFKLMRISFHSNLYLNADYEQDGEIYGLPINASGKAQAKINNLQVEIIIIFDIVKNEQGKDVTNPKTCFCGADAIGGIHHHFGNLFNGNKIMEDKVHALLNKTWRTAKDNYGRFFLIKLTEEICETIKIYMRSWPLEDIAIYKSKN